jgi:transposase
MVAVGVDTHKHEHLARAVDGLGQLLGGLTIKASLHGYIELTQWLRTLGEDVVVGIEGAGSYGAGLCEFLLAEGIAVVEVERPRRQDRRRGKSDEIDALMAAKKVLAKDGLSTPRAGGTRQALAALLIAQRSCVSERTRLLNQLQALHTTAPVALRERVGPGNGRKLAARLVKMRARSDTPQSEQLIFTVLRDLARRAQELAAQADAYKHELTELVSSLDPTLLDEYGVGPISAAKLLVCDPRRLKGEAAFARCNGTAPNPPPPGRPSATASHAEATAKRTTRCTRSPASAHATTSQHAPTSSAAKAKARPPAKPCAHSSATSPAASTRNSSPSP